MLQKSKASPFFGLTETPFLLLIPLASGNTVSPPLSTSELISYTMTEKKKINIVYFFFYVADEKDYKDFIYGLHTDT